MDFNAHGGHCCGRRHLSGMNGETVATIHATMDRYHLRNDNGNGGMLTEVVLSDDENDEDTWDAVREAGFIEVLSWNNSNSGNRCTMFVHTTESAELALNAGAVQQVRVEVPAPAPVAPPAPAPRIVLSTYHNVYRAAGRSECGWNTRDQAADRGAFVRIDRRDVYASGAVRWVEGV